MIEKHCSKFPHISEGKESACDSGDPGSIPGWKDSLGEGNDIRFSHLENTGLLSSIDLPNIDPFHYILSKPTFAIITTSCIIKVLDIAILSRSHGGKYQLSKF